LLMVSGSKCRSWPTSIGWMCAIRHEGSRWWTE